jgi:hypothetical protein
MTFAAGARPDELSYDLEPMVGWKILGWHWAESPCYAEQIDLPCVGAAAAIPQADGEVYALKVTTR